MRWTLYVYVGTLKDNFAAVAPEVYLLDMQDGWKVKDTTIGSDCTPYNPQAPGGSVVAVHAPPAGCHRHPCPDGHFCEYQNYSTFCPRCFHTLFSDDVSTRAMPATSLISGDVSERLLVSSGH